MRAPVAEDAAPAPPPPGDEFHPACEVAFIRPRLLRVLCYVVRQAGADVDRLCLGLGFAPADLNDARRRFSPRQVTEFVKRAAQVMPEMKEILLRSAAGATITQYDLLGFAQLSCPTLREAMEVGMEFQRLAGMPADLGLESDGKEFRVTLDEWFPDGETGAFLVDVACAFLVKEMSLLLGRPFVPLRVEFAYAASPWRASYPRLFGCPVVFNARQTSIVGPVELLDTPLPTQDRLTREGLVERLRQDSVAYQSDLLEMVGHMLRRDLRNPPTIAEVAKRIHMSERSLRRRLQDAGISYRDLLGRMRAATAAEMLKHGRFTVEEVAELVGFSNADNLRRAFRRWTGKLPGAVKRARS